MPDTAAADAKAAIPRAPGHGAGGILFFDLKSQAERLRAEIDARVARVLDHGAYIGGPEVGELEDRLAAFTGARHALAVASGTDALVIAMMGEELGPGDAVFLPAFTYNATCNAVIVAGAVPVLVDVDPATCNIDVADLEAKVDAVVREGRLRPRMIVPVDLYGLPADYPAIARIAARHGMTVLADAAQSFGAALTGTRAGALADMTATSFYPTKTLGCYGDGGALFTDDAARLERWKSIRWHGTDAAKRESVRVGLNGRLDSIQCAVLLAKLTVFEDELAARRRLAARYRRRLANRVGLQEIPDGAESAWGLFTIRVENRDAVQARLKDAGVPTSIYYPIPIHRHAAFARFAPEGGLPGAETLAASVLSLPFHPYLNDAELDHVVDSLAAAL